MAIEAREEAVVGMMTDATHVVIGILRTLMMEAAHREISIEAAVALVPVQDRLMLIGITDLAVDLDVMMKIEPERGARVETDQALASEHQAPSLSLLPPSLRKMSVIEERFLCSS